MYTVIPDQQAHRRKLIAGDAKAMSLYDAAMQRKPGGDHGNQYTGGKSDNISIGKLQYGTSSQAALRRLRKARPDLLARVEAGELSPHGAMIQAGFRKKTITVSGDILAGLIKLWAKATVEERAKFLDEEADADPRQKRRG